MAVTGAIFNSLIFGGVDSANYGIYITGEAVYNAPERAVEMVTVPGRNGAIAIDQGRWENIEVEYPAGCFGDGDANFADRISAFRNAVLSQIGYQRLTDTYHPDEYRQAIYVAGLEVEPANINSAGEFKLIFNCKPQRFLTSGETAVTVTSGGTITNPTLYKSSPLLEVEGYGHITVGNKLITLTNVTVGYLVLDRNRNLQNGTPVAYPLQLVNSADNVTIHGMRLKLFFEYATPSNPIQNITVIDSNNLITASYKTSFAGDTGEIYLYFSDFTIKKGAGKNGTGSVSFVTTSTTSVTMSYSIQFVDNTFVCSMSMGTNANYSINVGEWHLDKMDVKSTETLLGHPTYIDCDIGEAYKIVNGEIVSLNGYIDLGSDLPTLAIGANVITFDNTVTNFKVRPRWWKL